MILIMLSTGIVYPLLSATGYHQFNIIAAAIAMLLITLILSTVIIRAARFVFGRYSRIVVGS